jgi:hypothetical protein
MTVVLMRYVNYRKLPLLLERVGVRRVYTGKYFVNCPSS